MVLKILIERAPRVLENNIHPKCPLRVGEREKHLFGTIRMGMIIPMIRPEKGATFRRRKGKP
jgi:hypothetical protein